MLGVAMEPQVCGTFWTAGEDVVSQWHVDSPPALPPPADHSRLCHMPQGTVLGSPIVGCISTSCCLARKASPPGTAGETGLQRTVLSRVTQHCAVQWSRHGPPDPPAMAAVGTEFTPGSEVL